MSMLNDMKGAEVDWRDPAPRDNKWFLPDLTPMQDVLNENARKMAALMSGYAIPVVFMAGTEDDGVPLADQEIPPEGTE